MEKQLPIDAPTNGTMILAQFETMPTVLAAMWNGGDEKWVAANPQTDFFKDEWIDTYFESDYFSHQDMKWWCEIPDGNMDQAKPEDGDGV